MGQVLKFERPRKIKRPVELRRPVTRPLLWPLLKMLFLPVRFAAQMSLSIILWLSIRVAAVCRVLTAISILMGFLFVPLAWADHWKHLNMVTTPIGLTFFFATLHCLSITVAKKAVKEKSRAAA